MPIHETDGPTDMPRLRAIDDDPLPHDMVAATLEEPYRVALTTPAMVKRASPMRLTSEIGMIPDSLPCSFICNSYGGNSPPTW